MRKIQKITSVLMALSLLTLGFTACGPTPNSGEYVPEAVDKARTQLYVYSFNGGYGNQWLLKIKERFEAEYANYQGVNGKVGVQIMPDIASKKIGTEIIETFSTNTNDVFFTESVFYYDWVKDGSSKSLMKDITSAVTTPLTDLNETQSVYDKMTAEQKDFFNAGTEENKKIFAVPYRTDIEGIIYDVDLFNESSLYYAKGGCPSEYSTFTQNNNADKASGSFTGYEYTNLAGARSAGPDGKYGTDDDGLPATYDEFFNLCDYMAYENSITPFTWGGKPEIRANYLNWLYQQLLADYEGLEGYTSYFTYEGTSNKIVESIDDQGNIVWAPTTDIANDGSVIAKSAGRYYATKFFERLIKNSDYYDGMSFNGTQTHMAAQQDYLESKDARERIAFLVDGIWWENEASETFEEMADIEESDSRLNRKFSLLPLPKATEDQIGEKSTYVDTHASLCFVSANIDADRVDIAEKFVRFCFTNLSNKEFNLMTGCPRAMGGYTIDDTDKKELSYFGQSIYKIVTTAPIVAPYGKNAVYKANVSNRHIQQGGILTTTEASIFDEFKYGNNTAEKIFRNSMNGLADYFK